LVLDAFWVLGAFLNLLLLTANNAQLHLVAGSYGRALC
jgi:hypothetical protein